MEISKNLFTCTSAAESMGYLEEFLQNYKGNKTHPNLTAAVTHGMPQLPECYGSTR